ncbi:MAG: Phosphate-import permease protein PhnE [Kerstersia gyiorum]|uniref:phosphonate ABC transporter, permease protein PhnE n=1 Tax=Kerstersia gyiorum TaxID=206506 RepID=UPI0030CC64E6
MKNTAFRQTSRAVQAPVWRHRSPAAQRANWLCWLLGALLFYLGWHEISENTIWVFAADAPSAAWDMISRMFPPRWHYTGELWQPLLDTIHIATLGTAIGAALAIPLAFLAARNTTPSRWLARPAALIVIVTSRSINSLIWAMLLVIMLGPGPLAGTIAIALRSIGFIGKLIYEAIEETDSRQVEAILATGASSLQVLGYGIVPQVMPAIVGTVVYRWDVNIRESTILGIVGAGGLGLPLAASVDTLAWPQVTLIFIAILVMVGIAEWLSNRIRSQLI